MDSNHRPLPCQGSALDQLSYGPAANIRASDSNGCEAIPATLPQLPNSCSTATIAVVPSPPIPPEISAHPFSSGAIVVLTLGNPREKFWGALLALHLAGVSLSGIELSSFDDCVAMLKDGEPFSPGVVFFPMHRVERMELDLPEGDMPSLAQRFAAKTGLDAVTILAHPSADTLRARQAQP